MSLLGTIRVVTFQLQLMLLFEEDDGKNNAGEWASKALKKRQWKQRIAEGGKAQEEIKRKEEPKGNLMRLLGRRWTCCIRPWSTIATFLYTNLIVFLFVSLSLSLFLSFPYIQIKLLLLFSVSDKVIKYILDQCTDISLDKDTLIKSYCFTDGEIT